MAKKQKRTMADITTEFAGKMEKGRLLVKKNPIVFLHLDKDNCIHGCAVGMAYAGQVGDAHKAYQSYAPNRDSGPLSFLSRELKVPMCLLWDVSDAYMSGRRITTIINHLRQGKFDKCVDV